MYFMQENGGGTLKDEGGRQQSGLTLFAGVHLPTGRGFGFYSTLGAVKCMQIRDSQGVNIPHETRSSCFFGSSSSVSETPK